MFIVKELKKKQFCDNLKIVCKQIQQMTGTCKIWCSRLDNIKKRMVGKALVRTHTGQCFSSVRSRCFEVGENLPTDVPSHSV